MLHIDCHILPHLTLMGRFRQQRGWDHNGRTLGEHLLMVMWQGDCRVTVEDKSYQMGSGDAMIIRDELIPAMRRLREDGDAAEMLTSKKYWPLPNYGLLMFGEK